VASDILSHEPIYWIGELCFGAGVLGCLYLLTASILVLRWKKRCGTPGCRVAGHDSPPVTILLPLHGLEPQLFGRLSRFCLQDYTGDVQLAFGTNVSSDPAIRVVERLRRAFPQKAVTLKIDSQEHGPNRKISNLANMTRAAQCEILIAADSDIEVGSRHVAQVVAELEKPGVGAVSCLYHGIPGAGLWSRLSALAINGHLLPDVVVALSFGLATPCFGATLAMRRSMLRSIGGFSAFADFLAEDYAIGQAVRAAGRKVAILPVSVGHVCFERDFKSLFRRHVRFARTIRSIDPVGHGGSIITHPFPLAVLGILFGHTACLFLAAAALGCRLIGCISVEKAFGLPSQQYWLIPMQDVIAFVAYLVSFFGATVDWRGHRYRLLSNGSFAQIEK
jgi:ceramide glucosyltransferase